MKKLTDPNPYDTLDISPDADRDTIKQAAARQRRKKTSQKERQHVVNARKALYSTEDRLLIDAFTPQFLMDFDRDTIEQLKLDEVDPIHWEEIVNPDEVFQQSAEALLRACVHYILISEMPDPQPVNTPNFEHDGLDDFVTAWLDTDDQ